MNISVSTSQQASKVKRAVQKFFDKNPDAGKIPAKDLMPHFIEEGIFTYDHRNGLPIRNLLRELDRSGSLELIPHVLPKRKKVNTNWFFVPVAERTTDQPNKVNDKLPEPDNRWLSNTIDTRPKSVHKRDASDEAYVIDLCDDVLGKKASRQHTFDFLRGDPGRNGQQGKKLPVDAYYSELKLVVEYRERQHTEEVKHFDKPDKMTVSGVHRGEQRKIYDQRRRELLPQHNIRLVEISYSDFQYNGQKKIIRNKDNDTKVVKRLLKENGIKM
jgi:hypothetical protein